MTDSTAQEFERFAFTPHGEIWQESSLDTLDKVELLFTGKQVDAETGWYNFGARYLDPKTGIWLSSDPALGEYIPRAPLTKEDKEANGKLPGNGGIYNPVNFALYHFAGNNPVKYTDPDGKYVIPMPQKYLMTDYTGNMKGSTSPIAVTGCWLIFLANVTGTDVSTLNDKYVSNGSPQTWTILNDSKLTMVPKTKDNIGFASYRDDRNKGFYIAAQVPYNKAGDLHWVGVTDVVKGKDGKDYVQITPTSKKDTLSNSWRTDAGWRLSDDGKNIWVPLRKVNEFRVVSDK